MYYPHFINCANYDNKIYKFYDVDIIERNFIYPFTYNNVKYDVNENVINENLVNIVNNDFIKLPDFENLMLDMNGLPFIPHNT
jgi:hypothetical protein